MRLKHKVADNYPKVEDRGTDFIKDTSIIRNLNFVIQQVTIIQGFLSLH
jgi:hypothetical protein